MCLLKFKKHCYRAVVPQEGSLICQQQQHLKTCQNCNLRPYPGPGAARKELEASHGCSKRDPPPTLCFPHRKFLSSFHEKEPVSCFPPVCHLWGWQREAATQAAMYKCNMVRFVYAGQRHVSNPCGPHVAIQAPSEERISGIPSKIMGFSVLLDSHPY